MAILESIDSSGSESTTTQAANERSVAHVSGEFGGVVKLQFSPSGEDSWVTLETFVKPGSLPILTPDNSLDYRYLCVIVRGSAILYFGA